MTKEKAFWVTSMYGAKNRAPLVTVTVPDGGMHQMAPEEARDLALNLLLGAEAAEQDGFIVEWAMESLNISEENAAKMLHFYREWREKRRKA